MPRIKPKSRVAKHKSRKDDSGRSTAPRQGGPTAVKNLSTIDQLVDRLKHECADGSDEDSRSPEGKVKEEPFSLPNESRAVTSLPLYRGRVGVRAGALEETQLALFDQEAQGRFVAHPLQPGSEYPTILTRIPIFVPGKRTNQRELLDNENAIPFATPWGTGKKYGPPLTVYDEDTLIAIGLLRESQLVGRPSKLPISVPETYRRADADNVTVHLVTCMITDIQDVCGSSHGGRNIRLRLESVRRLSNTTIELSGKTAGRDIIRGTSIKLIDVAWEDYKENAVLLIQFSPIMALWFDRHYSYLDWTLRRKLNDTGKAIHRFLSGQGAKYKISAIKLMTTIGFMGSYKEFMRALRGVMNQLKAEGWVETYEIVGSGRTTPHLLKVTRRRRQSKTKDSGTDDQPPQDSDSSG